MGAADPELVAERERARELTRRYNRTTPDDHENRRDLLEKLLGSLGGECHVEPPFRCDYGYNIHVGENFDCVILDVCRVDIGQSCMIGPDVHIYTATHPLDADERIKGPENGKPVTVGDNAVIASGAVVTDDVPGDAVIQGNPATVVKELETDD